MVNIQQIISALIMIPLNAWILMISTKIFKIADTSYRTAIKICLILGIINIAFYLFGFFVLRGNPILLMIGTAMFFIVILVVSVIIAIFLIKTKYQIEWSKTVLVWLVWFVLSMIVTLIIVLISGIIIAILSGGGIIIGSSGVPVG